MIDEVPAQLALRITLMAGIFHVLTTSHFNSF